MTSLPVVVRGVSCPSPASFGTAHFDLSSKCTLKAASRRREIASLSELGSTKVLKLGLFAGGFLFSDCAQGVQTLKLSATSCLFKFLEVLASAHLSHHSRNSFSELPIFSRKQSVTRTGCHPAAEQKPITIDNALPGTQLLSTGHTTLSRLSQFLQELAQLDCWSGLLDPDGSVSIAKPKSPRRDLNLSTISPGYLQDTSISTSSVSYFSVSLGDRISNAPVADVASFDASNNRVSGSASLSTSVTQLTFSDLPSTNTIMMAKTSGSHLDRPISVAPGIQISPFPESSSVKGKLITAVDIVSLESLAQWLEKRLPSGKCKVSQWGVAPGTKPMANLWCELLEGEISLEDNSPPKRTVHVASVKIRNDDGLVLVESYQQMADGRIRPRNSPLSEKMRPGESVEEACLRGIFEELGCKWGASERVTLLPESYRRQEEERESFSYPGLLTRYVIHNMAARVEQLPAGEFVTDEDESGHGTNGGGESVKREGIENAVGVKRHFWAWIPESQIRAHV